MCISLIMVVMRLNVLGRNSGPMLDEGPPRPSNKVMSQFQNSFGAYVFVAHGHYGVMV